MPCLCWKCWKVTESRWAETVFTCMIHGFYLFLCQPTKDVWLGSPSISVLYSLVKRDNAFPEDEASHREIFLLSFFYVSFHFVSDLWDYKTV